MTIATVGDEGGDNDAKESGSPEGAASTSRPCWPAGPSACESSSSRTIEYRWLMLVAAPVSNLREEGGGRQGPRFPDASARPRLVSHLRTATG